MVVTLSIIAALTGNGDGDSSNDTSGTEESWEEHCAEWAPQARADHPDVYFTNQEAYDSCMKLPGVVNELKGNIDRQD